MSIVTEDGIIAGLKPPFSFVKNSFTGEAAGQWHNLGVVGGRPGAWTLGSPGINGVAVSYGDLGGEILFDNPASGEARLARLSAAVGAAVVGLMLYDLMWYNSAIAETTTTEQAIASAALPARDISGTVNGDGVQAWMHCTTATTNGAAVSNTTLNYTNQAGTAARSAGLAYSWPATAVAGTMVPFGTQGGDRGVQSIEGVTLGTSYGGGQVELLMLRPIVMIGYPAASTGQLLDWAQLGFPRVFDDSALYLAALLSGTGAGVINGNGNFAHG